MRALEARKALDGQPGGPGGKMKQLGPLFVGVVTHHVPKPLDDVG
jgi:hypothetical protein